MEIICLKNNLKEGVMLVEKAVSKNLNLPVLGSILISTNNDLPGRVKLTATNLELGIEVIIPAKVEKNGIVAVPAGVLSSFISNFSGNENINLKAVKDNIIISTSNSSTLIKSYPSGDFPSLPVVKKSKQFSILIKNLINGLKSVFYSASLSNIKPEISSVYIAPFSNSSIVFVSTDSFRLAEKKIESNLKDFIPVIIPFRNIIEIIRVFEDKEGEVEIIIDKNQIIFMTDQIKLISRLIDGVFPDYKQLIPTKFTTVVTINKTVLNDSLKTAGIFSGKLNEVQFNIKADENIFKIKTLSQDIGEYNNSITTNIRGDDLIISFNCKYIFDCLNHLSSEEINLQFNKSNKPMVITNTNDNSFQYLVMPMNK